MLLPDASPGKWLEKIQQLDELLRSDRNANDPEIRKAAIERLQSYVRDMMQARNAYLQLHKDTHVGMPRLGAYPGVLLGVDALRTLEDLMEAGKVKKEEMDDETNATLSLLQENRKYLAKINPEELQASIDFAETSGMSRPRGKMGGSSKKSLQIYTDPFLRVLAWTAQWEKSVQNTMGVKDLGDLPREKKVVLSKIRLGEWLGDASGISFMADCVGSKDEKLAKVALYRLTRLARVQMWLLERLADEGQKWNVIADMGRLFLCFANIPEERGLHRDKTIREMSQILLEQGGHSVALAMRIKNNRGLMKNTAVAYAMEQIFDRIVESVEGNEAWPVLEILLRDPQAAPAATMRILSLEKRPAMKAMRSIKIALRRGDLSVDTRRRILEKIRYGTTRSSYILSYGVLDSLSRNKTGDLAGEAARILEDLPRLKEINQQLFQLPHMESEVAHTMPGSALYGKLVETFLAGVKGSKNVRAMESDFRKWLFTEVFDPKDPMFKVLMKEGMELLAAFYQKALGNIQEQEQIEKARRERPDSGTGLRILGKMEKAA